jgi:hypothetical protein
MPYHYPANPDLEKVALIFTQNFGYVAQPALEKIDRLLKLDEITCLPYIEDRLQSLSDIIWAHYPFQAKCSEVAAIIAGSVR